MDRLAKYPAGGGCSGWKSVFGAVLLAALAAYPAMAAQPGGEHTPQYTLETVTVTAQKKEENVQDIPASVSVFTADTVEETGSRNTKDLLRYAPNVFVRDAGSYYQTTIRGVSGFINSTHSGVGYYVDDVSLSNVFMQNPDLLDVERVEVLKGPQGTLYGRNTEAGVINIVTRQPGNELRGRIFNEVSFYDTNHGYQPGNKVGMNFSGPVVEDTLYLGVAGTWNYNTGFVKNDYTNDDKAQRKNQVNGRATLRWTPVEEWDITLIADATDARDNYAYGRYFSGGYKTKRNHVDMDGQHFRDYNANGQTLRAKYSGKDFDFVSITGRRSFDENSKNDMDMTGSPMIQGAMRDKERFWSQEFRVSSPAESKSPFKWLAGTYFFHEKLDIDSEYEYFPGSMMAMLAGRDTNMTMKGAALFGEGTYTLFDRLHLTAGLRYDHFRMRGSQDVADPTYMAYDSYSHSTKNDELLPKFSIAYDITPEVMTYATVAKGYLSGGYDYTSATSKDSFSYKPEYTWNYEWGLKTSWMDNRLTANLALFYIDMKDKQVTQMDPYIFRNYVDNAGKAHSYGVELELAARPWQGWDFFGAFGYTKTKVDEWEAFDGTGMYNYEGNELPNAPRFNYTLGAQYSHESGIWGRVELVGTGKYYHDAKNELKENGYEIVNLRLGYQVDNFDISIWCKNLFDEKYNDVQFGITGFGKASFEGAPRQFGMTVGYTF